jgi:hypothetical protein
MSPNVANNESIKQEKKQTNEGAKEGKINK